MAAISLIGIAAAFIANIWAYTQHGSAFQDMIVNDGYGTFFRGLVLVVGFLCILTSFSYLEREGAQGGEYYALILFSLVGQCILATSADLIMVFIGLEISSIATYILAGYLRDDRRNNESALKYFLLGSFATAFLLIRYRLDLRLRRIDKPRRNPSCSGPFSARFRDSWLSRPRSYLLVLGSKSRLRHFRCGRRTFIRALPRP